MNCFKEYTPKEVIVLLLVIGAIGLGTVSILRERIIRVDRDLLTVRAEGKIYARPDIANISFGFKTGTVKEAGAAINEGSMKMNEIIAALKKWGIEDRDIKTTNYNLQTIYEYPEASGKAILVGYELSQNVTVKVRNILKVGEVINEASRAGANQVGGINFGIDDPEKLKAEALEKGIQNAKMKAKGISNFTGVKLGKIVNVYEYDYSVPAYGGNYMMEKSVMADQGMGIVPSVEGGEIEVIINVDLTYEVK